MSASITIGGHFHANDCTTVEASMFNVRQEKYQVPPGICLQIMSPAIGILNLFFPSLTALQNFTTILCGTVDDLATAYQMIGLAVDGYAGPERLEFIRNVDMTDPTKE